MGKYVVGVDVGGTTVKLGFFDTEGVFLDKWEIPTRVEEEGSHILPDVAESIKKKLEEKRILFGKSGLECFQHQRKTGRAFKTAGDGRKRR